MTDQRPPRVPHGVTLASDRELKVPIWKSYLYQLQQQAPKPQLIKPARPLPQSLRPTQYGDEYHGAISREDADILLSRCDGCFLVRESQRAQGAYTLGIRFGGVTKNFKLYFDGQHFVGEKRFDSVDDLVADGLITFYLESKAADYISMMSSQSNYADSPYQALKSQRRQNHHRVHNNHNNAAHNHKSPRDGANGVAGVKSLPGHTRPPQPPPPPQSPSYRQNLDDGGSPVLTPHLSKGPSFFGPRGDDTRALLRGHSRSSDSLDSVNSQLSTSTTETDVAHYEKKHIFKAHTFAGLNWCDYCANFMWGLVSQGVRCQDCGFSAHKKCSENVPNDCMPDLKHIKTVFGIDLTTLAKAHNCSTPLVVDLCIDEIERRKDGLTSEGIYRISGFNDDIEALRMAFDRDLDKTDLSTTKYDDINVITGVLKLYLRLLPIPVVTFDAYPAFMESTRASTPREQIERLTQAVALLPPAHYHTLKAVVTHLGRVLSHKDVNRMTAENLGTVFGPTLMRCPDDLDPMAHLTAAKYDKQIAELLVKHHAKLFPPDG